MRLIMRRESSNFPLKLLDSAAPPGDAFALELTNSNAKQYYTHQTLQVERRISMKKKLGIAFFILFESVMYITINYFMISATLNHTIQPVSILGKIAGSYLMYLYWHSMKEMLTHKWLASVLAFLCLVITIVILYSYGYMKMTAVPLPSSFWIV